MKKIIQLLLHAFVLIMETLERGRKNQVEEAVQEDYEAIDNDLDKYLSDGGLLDDRPSDEGDKGHRPGSGSDLPPDT